MPADNFESYADLTGSFTDQSTEQYILSGSDINLNIDYNDFSNHTIFGSAVTKLENFKSKVSNIELYLNKISSSLASGSLAQNSITGDSTARKDLRKIQFSNIQDTIGTFTPYERFLYYDHQSQTTSSAPGLGINLAHNVPVTGSFATLTNYDGFNIVYKHTGSETSDSDGMNYFKGKYRAEEKPFFNYSGSLYLSFLLKGDHAITSMSFENRNLSYAEDAKAPLPSESFASSSILHPAITGSEWRRFIFEASQSYWRPSSGHPSTIDIDFADQTHYEILSQSEQILSASDVPAGSSYLITLHGDFYPTIGTVYPSGGMAGIPYTGSLLPAGELFRISGSFGGIPDDTAVTASYMTDIKITTKNPLNTLPFSYTYKTGSSEWNNWYTGMQSSASAYDDKNIHSFVSNLPDAIREDSDTSDLKQFLNMIAEQFDLVRNYIDNYQSFYKRRYDKLNSVPTNLLPVLANNLGWDVTQILTGSLSQYFGTSQEDIKVGGRTAEEITHNTWRKVLNNLIYIYKTKGTLTGVNALLNVYGYPGDVLKIQEIGGSAQEHNPTHITDNITKLLEGARGLSGNASFIKFVDELYSWIFNNNNARTLNFDWWTNSATDLNTVEFILKPHRCLNNDQILLESSGSGAEKLWDVRLLATGSDATLGKLQFRLNNTHSGSSAIASNAVSMSTSYLPLKADGNLWNVMLQRATSSISGTGIQTYKLFAGLQDKDKITQFSAVSMSVSGGHTVDNPSGSYYANQNWLSTGSLSTAASGNLYIGRTYTGSLAEFRTWTTALSASKFKQHILNKKSTVGNNIDASRDEVTYRYALQENWKRGSTSPKIEDSNPNNVKDYTSNISTGLLTGSVLYDRDDIDIVKFSIRIGGADQPDDNKIIMNPSVDITSNLKFDRSSESSIYHSDKYGEIKRYHTSKLQLVRSPQKILNEFIIDNLADYDISGKFADPQDLYETYYNDLNNLRDDLFNHFNVTIDINKWIRAQANIFNPPVIESIQRVLPARSTIQNIGVMFEPTLLERDKIKNPQVSVATGSAAGQLGFIHDIIPYYDFTDSAYLDIKTNLNPIEVASDISLVDSMYVSSKDGEYSVIDLIDEKGFYLDVKNAEYDIESNIVKEMSYQPSKDVEYDIESNIIKEMSYEPSRNAEYDIEGNITKEISYQPSKDTEYNVESNIAKEISYQPSKNAEYDIESNIAKEISYQPSKNVEYNVESNIAKEILYQPSKNVEYNVESNITKGITYELTNDGEYNVYDPIIETGNIEDIIKGEDPWIASQSYASFVNLADSWGTSSDDVHFLAPDSASKLANIGYYEQDFVFKIVGDVEFILGQYKKKEFSPIDADGENRMATYRADYTKVDFNDANFFLNREIRDKEKGYTYNSYIRNNTSDTFEGPQDGRPVGKTSYYATRSNGDLIYPSNHWIHFSEDSLRSNFIKGTQNIGGHYMELNKWRDYSTSSFYSITVTGESGLEVVRGVQTIGSDGKIDRGGI